jgi:hypothetical protein
MTDPTTKALYEWLGGINNPTGKITATFDLTTQADLTAIKNNTSHIVTNLYKMQANGGLITNGMYTAAEGGVFTSPSHVYLAEAGYPEAVIPMKDGQNIPVKWISGGTNQAGAGATSDEEVALLRELIDVLKAKDTSPTVTVNVDSKGIIKEAGRYVSERTKRGTLEVRAH